MDLFNSTKLNNALPFDGEVVYLGPIMPIQEAQHHYNQLLDKIAWEHDEAMIFGKHIITKRKVAWYAAEHYAYTYSKITKTANIWTPELLALKQLVEELSGETFNSCLLNLYHSGDEGMAWHNDGEKDLKKNGTIASVSFGAERKFSFKHKTSKTKVDILLEKGSLLLMKGETQQYWLHRLPPTKKVNTPRINLTFRTVNS